MTNDTLRTARLKLARAYRHIEEMEAFGPGSSLGASHRFVVDEATQPGGRQFMRLEVDPPRGAASVIVGEAIYQLRSALDVAVVALSRKNGLIDIGGVYFPFASSLHELMNSPLKEGSPQWKIRGLPDATKQIIYDLHPYKGGNEALCGLNVLRNEDVHIELIAVVFETSNIIRVIPRVSYEDMFAAEIGGILSAAEWNSGGFHDGLVIDVTRVTTDLPKVIDVVNAHLELFTRVLFTDTKAFQGEPVVATLQELGAVVSDVIDMFEAAS